MSDWTALKQAAEKARYDKSATLAFIAEADPMTILELIYEAEQLLKDAERYRWLRKTESWDGSVDSFSENWIVESYEEVINKHGESLDVAIDAAMREEKP